MVFYKGKKVTLDLVIGLTISVIALGTVENARTQNMSHHNQLVPTVSEQVISFNRK